MREATYASHTTNYRKWSTFFGMVVRKTDANIVMILATFLLISLFLRSCCIVSERSAPVHFCGTSLRRAGVSDSILKETLLAPPREDLEAQPWSYWDHLAVGWVNYLIQNSSYEGKWGKMIIYLGKPGSWKILSHILVSREYFVLITWFSCSADLPILFFFFFFSKMNLAFKSM